MKVAILSIEKEDSCKMKDLDASDDVRYSTTVSPIM